MNKLVNEAVKDYLQQKSANETELETRLNDLRAYRAASEVEPTAAHTLDKDTRRATDEFVRRVSDLYPVRTTILFGSRARGTHQPSSDADIAIVLRGVRGNVVDTTLEMADIAFDVLLETRVYIQPVLIWEEEWAHPDTHSNPQLLQNIAREGLVL